MTAAERRLLLASVATLLETEIHGQFLELYAAAVSATEKHPEQVNNELRNALTHIARAVSVPDLETANGELEKALSHIERAKRDAVKIAVIFLRDRIAEACGDIKRLNGSIETGFLVRRDVITRKRKLLLKREAKGHQVLNEFIELYLETDDLNDELHSVLALTTKLRPRWQYWLHSMRRQFVAGAVGVMLGVMACMIYAVVAPDNAAFGNNIRKALHFHIVSGSPPSGAVKATAPNTPSTAAAPSVQEVRSRGS